MKEKYFYRSEWKIMLQVIFFHFKYTCCNISKNIVMQPLINFFLTWLRQWRKKYIYSEWKITSTASLSIIFSVQKVRLLYCNIIKNTEMQPLIGIFFPPCSQQWRKKYFYRSEWKIIFQVLFSIQLYFLHKRSAIVT